MRRDLVNKLSGALARGLRAPLRVVPRGAVVRVLMGPLRGARWIVGAATHGSWIGNYEPVAQRAFVRFVQPGSVVYDIGANAGFFTLLAARLAGEGGRVFAFEPLPRNLVFLRRHLELNRVTNVEVVPLALSDVPGRVRMTTSGSAAMGRISAEGDLEVESTPLDALGLPPPAFVKMDIEGSEHAALRGAMDVLRAARPVVLLSAHGYAQRDACTELLSKLGYGVETLRDGALDGDYVLLATPAA